MVAEKKLYEAMFLIDSGLALSDWDGIIKLIEGILAKASCEIVSMKKWDDRMLAYRINGKSRGTYILCYFRAEGLAIQTIEREVRLSERIVRALILRADLMSQADIDKETPAIKATKRNHPPDIQAAQDPAVRPVGKEEQLRSSEDSGSSLRGTRKPAVSTAQESAEEN